MRELNSSLAPHLELWIVISLNFLKILYQKFLEKSNFHMVLGTRVELVMQEWKSWVLTTWPTEHISSLLPLSSTVGCCLAAGRLSDFHWANRVLELTFWWARVVSIHLLQRKRVYSPPQLPICYWPIYGGSPRTRTADILLNRQAL